MLFYATGPKVDATFFNQELHRQRLRLLRRRQPTRACRAAAAAWAVCLLLTTSGAIERHLQGNRLVENCFYLEG